jgi:hypothetical protein
LPKPVCRARSETLRVPRCILRSNSVRRRSCIWVKFICGKSASSHGDDRSQFSFSKPIRVFRASFSRFLCTSNRTNEELCLAALTQKIQLSTLGLLQLAQVVGNSRGCGSFAQSNEGCSLVRSRLDPSTANGDGGFSWIYKAFLQPASNSPSSDSRFCALILMTITARAQTASAHQGTRTLSAAAWLLSPRLTAIRKLNEREKAIIWGIGHGIVRATKNLRGLRMSLVPPPRSGDRILQSM